MSTFSALEDCLTGEGEALGESDGEEDFLRFRLSLGGDGENDSELLSEVSESEADGPDLTGLELGICVLDCRLETGAPLTLGGGEALLLLSL